MKRFLLPLLCLAIAIDTRWWPAAALAGVLALVVVVLVVAVALVVVREGHQLQRVGVALFREADRQPGLPQAALRGGRRPAPTSNPLRCRPMHR